MMLVAMFVCMIVLMMLTMVMAMGFRCGTGSEAHGGGNCKQGFYFHF